MAGSNKYFIYTADNEVNYAILLDESNTEEVNASTQDYIADGTVIHTVPRNIKPRYAVYVNTARTRQIKCVALTPTIFAGIPANKQTITDPISGGSLNLLRIVPERIRLPFAADTGLTDGDAT